ncbi:MAG: fibronectin type III domain-containing protein, partial [Bryobacteraceae bacterium]
AAGACAEAGDEEVEPGAAGSFSETLPEGLRQGAARPLSYFVELRNDSGRSAGLSNAAVVLAGAAPGPVMGLEAEVRKAGVVLHWSAAGEGTATTAVRLRRTLLTPQATKKSSGQNGAMGGVLAPAPEAVEQNLLVETEGHTPDRALDKDIRFGEAYEYRAQQVARVKVDGETLELDGALSEPLRVEVRDVFAPAVPTGLAAVAVGASESGGGPAIDLSWQPDTEADLAGYVVYRREGSGDWLRISPAQAVVGPAFHDAHVEAGHSYSYAVSAIDESGHESGRSGEAMETVPGP